MAGDNRLWAEITVYPTGTEAYRLLPMTFDELIVPGLPSEVGD